jgi:alkylhydroperoxidase family enzyme
MQPMPERLVVRWLEAMCRSLFGYTPRVLPHAVHRIGPFAALRWFSINIPRYLITMRVLGPVRTHVAAIVISLYNGCTYCAFGHAYALELVYLRDHDRLFPLDARTIAGWLHLEPRELANRMHLLLQDAGLHVEALWVDRTLGLVTGAHQPMDPDEARIARLVRIVSMVNRMAIESGVAPDEAQNPINKDAAIKALHAELRAYS